MANLARVRAVWGGSPVVGGGVSTFYFDEAGSGFVAALGTFFSSVLGRCPPGTFVTIANTGDLIDIATGALSGTWTDGTTQTPAASNAGAYAAGVGTRVEWPTSGIRHGRRVRGSTYIVPIHSACYDVDGTLGGAYLTTFASAASTLYAAKGSIMKVYSRPSSAGGGQANQVIGANVPDRVSWLRSRRT